MLKTEDKQKALSEYTEEIQKRYPDANPRVMEDKVSTEDVWIRIEGIHPRSVDKVLRTAIRLQRKWYLERGVYIFVTVSGTGSLDA